MQCVNKNLREYRTLKKLSGLPDFVLSAYVGDFLDKYNRYPYLDELPNSDSSKAIKEDLQLDKNGTTKTENILLATNTDSIEEAVQSLNDKYRDKEIEVLEVGTKSKIYITERPTTDPKIEIQDSNQIELNTIKQRAIANGTFMKAPNGNPTNLNEKQWLQVRTKSFKDWFGDWENDPKNASKVIDENGEPLVVYHGTNIENITIFDRTQIPKNEALIGTGTATFGNFFSNKQDDAKSFASIVTLRRKSGKSTVYKTFLNIRNPMYFKTLGDFRNYSYKEGHYNENGDFVSDVKLPKKYDGVIVERRNNMDDAKEFVAPNKIQIKSAINNSGEFSKLNDDITDNEVNNFHYFNEVLDKLQTLYGINVIPITNAELNSPQWKDITGVNGVKAFIYNGNIYLNTDIATVDSPVHEFLHLLFGSMKYKNRTMYNLLVKSAEFFETYSEIAENYPNRTRGDINEEVFVTELAKYLTGQPSAINNLPEIAKQEIFYNVNRTLDSILMGDLSVKTILDPYQLSLKSLALFVNSASMKSNFNGSMNDATLNRIMANTKSELMKRGELREDCV